MNKYLEINDILSNKEPNFFRPIDVYNIENQNYHLSEKIKQAYESLNDFTMPDDNMLKFTNALIEQGLRFFSLDENSYHKNKLNVIGNPELHTDIVYDNDFSKINVWKLENDYEVIRSQLQELQRLFYGEPINNTIISQMEFVLYESGFKRFRLYQNDIDPTNLMVCGDKERYIK